MLQLFPDESQILESNNKSVLLTTHRIRYQYKDWGRSYNQSIMLEHITSCESYTGSLFIFLVLSIISAAVGLLGVGSGEGEYVAAALIIALLFFIIYWASRHAFIVVASPSTKMKIRIIGLTHQNMLDFLNKVELAKFERMKSFC